MNRLFIRWICGAIVAFIAIAASANPPMYKFNSRSYGNLAAAGGCSDFDGGYRCRNVQVWENYDVKGTYEYTEVFYQNERYWWDPDSDAYDHRWRYIVCPVDQKSIAALPKRVTIDIVINPEDPGCYQDGWHYGYDPDTGYYSEPFGFTGIWAIEGEWMKPFSYGSSVWNEKSKSYDGWSETTFHGVHHCNSRWGELMTSGGWSVSTPNGRTFFYGFEGPYGPMWSYFNVSSCNDKDMQK